MGGVEKAGNTGVPARSQGRAQGSQHPGPPRLPAPERGAQSRYGEAQGRRQDRPQSGLKPVTCCPSLGVSLPGWGF